MVKWRFEKTKSEKRDMCEKTKKRKRVMCKKIHTIVYVKTEIVKMSHAHSKTHVNLWGKNNSVSAMG